MKVIAEFVDFRNGKRYLPGDGNKIDPPLEDRQIQRLTGAQCLAEGDEPGGGKAATSLREDGPTIAEFVAAGYAAKSYPPQGYAARSTPAEIAAAVMSEKAGIDLDKLTVAELRKHADAAGIVLGTDVTKKADIIAAIELAAEAN